MRRLAAGDRRIDTPYVGRRDEIGDLAQALQVFLAAAHEQHAQTWRKTRIAEISRELQEVGSLRAFGDSLCRDLAGALGLGLIRVWHFDPERQRLGLQGSFGGEGDYGREFALGEGLVGQCAVDRRVLTLSDVPADYLRIRSGLGEAVPKQLRLQPVCAQERLLGVLEFALLQPLSLEQELLLDELLPLVALSLDNLGRALETAVLLEASRAQAEELQASEEELRSQQEELRASNDELHAKGRMLEQHQLQLAASEEELRQQAVELQTVNEELRSNGEMVEAQRAALERSNRYKSEFLANMSHELRTPLNSMLILSRSLADNEAGHLDADEIEAARIVHESGSNLLRLINDILDLSKVEAGKMQVVHEQVRLAELCSALRRRFQPVAEERRLGWQVNCDPQLPETMVSDGARIQQILTNLIGNAFKFTRQGQVILHVARPATDWKPRNASLTAERAIAFAVQDSGIGIPQQKLDAIFEAFEQVDGSTSRQYGGTGLGLSISRGLARLLGGEIMVESRAGEGSRFTLLLPLTASDGTIQEAALATPAPPVVEALSEPKTVSVAPAAVEFAVADDRQSLQAGERSILVVEDDPVFARILVKLIHDKGLRALAAGDGESGLRLAREYRPTGILLDVMLPGMDGWSVLDQLKADPLTRHVPVHFISATDGRASGAERGAVGFLSKPVDRQQLEEAFDRLLHFAPGAPRRVLVVDDDDASRAAVRRLIATDPVEVVEADSGETALQRLEESQDGFDLIILDLGLPQMSGFEFLEKLAQRGAMPPVVIHSGRDLSPDEHLQLRRYTDSIVVKGARSPERLIDEVGLFLHSVRTAPPVSAARDELAGRRVLLVDDDMRNVYAMSRVLRARGVDVVVAQDGQRALDLLADDRGIELVLMDIMMPGMDGYQATRAIRAQPALRSLPIIALTAKAMSGDRDKCLEAGASDYLSKPVDVDRLLSMMRAWLAGSPA
jgi:Signal transduction histidine kinase